jgi:hypothetical protein
MTPMDFSNANVSAAPDGSAILQVDGNTVQLAGVTMDQVNASYVEFNQQNPWLLSQQIMAAQS